MHRWTQDDLQLLRADKKGLDRPNTGRSYGPYVNRYNKWRIQNNVLNLLDDIPNNAAYWLYEVFKSGTRPSASVVKQMRNAVASLWTDYRGQALAGGAAISDMRVNQPLLTCIEPFKTAYHLLLAGSSQKGNR